MTYNYYGDTYLSSVVGGNNSYQLYYDALGRCVERKTIVGTAITTSYYLFDGERWVVEYDATGAVKSNTLYGLGIDEVIARGVNGGEWPLPDRNGNTLCVTGPMSEEGKGSEEGKRARGQSSLLTQAHKFC